VVYHKIEPMLHAHVRRTLGFAVIAVMLVGIFGSAAAMPGAKERWTETRTPHFVLFSDAGEAVVNEIGLRLERLRHVLSRLPGDLDLDPYRPTYIYVFKDWSSAKPYFPKTLEGGRVGGAFLGRTLANYVLINASPELDAQSLIHHEYLHAVMHQNFPHLPLWLGEGMAEFYSTFWADEEQAEIGGIIDDYLQRLRSDGLMPMGEFFAVTEDSREYQDSRFKQRFHAQAWALVHYLMMARPEHRLQLFASMKTWQREADSDARGTGLLPFTVGEIEARLEAYLKALDIPQSRLRTADWPADTVAATLPLERTDVLFRLGDLLAYTGSDDHRKTGKHFEAALRLDPGHAPSIAGKGMLALRSGDPGVAAAQFREASRLDPSSGLYPYLQAQALLREALGSRRPVPLASPPPDPRVVAAARLLEQAVQRAPRLVEARVSLGYAHLLGAGDAARGIEELSAALEMLPGRMDVAYQLYVMQLRSGRRDEAVELAARTLMIAPDEAWRERAETALRAFR